MSSPVITCNACEKKFTMTEDKIKNRQSGELVFRYLVCPHCGAAFISSTTNKKFRTMLNKNRMTQSQRIEISEMLNAKYFDVFKRLVPSAYPYKTDTTEGGNQDDQEQNHE